MSNIFLHEEDEDITLMLDPDLHWLDEFTWVQTEQALARSLTGLLVVEAQARLYGREITLSSPDATAGWFARADLQRLHAWEASDRVLTLSIRGQVFAVKFNRAAQPIEMTPVLFMSDAQPSDAGNWFTGAVRFITV
ncbi:MAG: hypothetical protein LBQ81_08670 [Zoogloeaceae bacterium]|nr:hypothetical protein [Zoogloeaceae bacterium]